MIVKKSTIQHLVDSSDYHSWWGDRELELYVARPISLGQCLIEDGVLATWGFPNAEQVEKYLATRRFDADWFAGGGDTVWLVDFICLGGGEANLVLVESDDPLDAGLEILCQPPGKKLSTLSLLSGGEQTLTAMALIFAVFLANPAPICVLDEVDAPLDDANVTRFCDLLDEMTRRTDTRFLIITHHAMTMARMDRLFGVTMAEPGVSQLVSVDLKKAEQLVA